jgi:Resolvase, N terminal domain
MTTLGDDVRVGIYVRRSTDDEHQPYSIEAQDTRPEAHIGSQPGWRFVARFPDDASGATTEREGLQRALAAAKAGLIDEPRSRSLPAPSFANATDPFFVLMSPSSALLWTDGWRIRTLACCRDGGLQCRM